MELYDPSTPSIARVYDYWLGGENNFGPDRELARDMLDVYPLIAHMARENRQFLGRAVGFAARSGIRQFIDVGAGLPTALSTHQVAQAAAPGVRVAYVDNDPAVIAHARALLARDDSVIAVPGDLRDPHAILADPQLSGLISLGEPVCVLLAGVLHLLDAEAARSVATAYTAAVACGSYLVISVGSGHPARATRMTSAYAAEPLYSHSHQQIARFFDGLEMVPPGLVPAAAWTADVAVTQLPWREATFLAGMGRKTCTAP